jgi:NodT family efflux transporter outer membrane factor (OMF) lipoprotein
MPLVTTQNFAVSVLFVLALAALVLRARAHRYLWAAAVPVVCGLTACTVGPFYHKPNIPPPPAWRETDTGPVVAATNGGTVGAAAVWPSAAWWQGFNSAQLNELITDAQKANDDLAAAIARVREADAQVRIAGAPLFPSLQATGDANRVRTKPASAPSGTPPVTFNQFAAQLGASYELDFWGKNLATRRSASFAAEASRYDRATVELTVMSSVAITYFQALESHDRLEVAQQDLATAQEVLKDLKTELSVGVINAVDVAQQETTVAVLSASIPPLQQQLRQSLNALAVLVGKLPQELEFPGGRLTELTEPQVRPGLPSELLARRPDVASSEAQLQAANADIQAARAAFFPSIDLTASGGFVSTALSTLFTPANRVFNLSGQLAQQIFAGGAITGKYQLTKARYTELLADYHKTVLTAFDDVENALVALQQTADQYQRQQEAVATARRAYDFTQTQLHAGVVNVLTVLNTQTALFIAQDTLVQVRFAHFQALVQLYSALGGGWQQNVTVQR